MGHSIDLAYDPIVFKIIVRSFSGFHTLEKSVESRKQQVLEQNGVKTLVEIHTCTNRCGIPLNVISG